MRNGPYELIYAPGNYPGKKYRNKYVYQHHLVWWEFTGNIVPDGFVVHHKNENKRDNRFKNLELQERGEHTARHSKPKNMQVLICSFCGAEFKHSSRVTKQNDKRFKGRPVRHFCCRSHLVKQQHKDKLLR